MSRKKILDNIRSNLPGAVQLPEVPLFEKEHDVIEAFISEASKSSRVIRLQHLPSDFEAYFENQSRILNQALNPVDGDVDIDVLVVRAELGVAENGALWVKEENMGRRILPFATQHLAIVIDADQLVGNMHQAYETINPDSTGFGVFIAGPSKTADIEQSLVVGAHGPRSLTIFLIEKEA